MLHVVTQVQATVRHDCYLDMQHEHNQYVMDRDMASELEQTEDEPDEPITLSPRSVRILNREDAQEDEQESLQRYLTDMSQLKTMRSSRHYPTQAGGIPSNNGCSCQYTMASPPHHAKRQRCCQEPTVVQVNLNRLIFKHWASIVKALRQERSWQVQLADEWYVKYNDSWQAAMEGIYWCSTCYDNGYCHGECPWCPDICRDD